MGTDLVPFGAVLGEAAVIAAGAAGLVQAGINALKLYRPTISAGFLILFSILFGIGLVNGVAIAAGQLVTPQAVALNSLAGLLAGFGAMGLHDLGSKASDAREAALYGDHIRLQASELQPAIGFAVPVHDEDYD